MTASPNLRAGAEALSAGLPPLLARARHLAATVDLGDHGRRRAGHGDAFWQFRPAQPGDPAHQIDWRRSGRSDHTYLQEKEWQAAQSVIFWVDPSPSMAFSSDRNIPMKSDWAKIMTIALASLLVRGGERVGLANMAAPAVRGDLGLDRLARALEENEGGALRDLPANARAVFISDFLGDVSLCRSAVEAAADRGVTGILFQVLDPVEEAFPFHGRTLFEDLSGQLEYDTHEAGDLRGRYLERLQDRKALLTDVAMRAGWQFHTHHTGDADNAALLWLYHALEGRT